MDINILIVDDDPIFSGLLHVFFDVQGAQSESVFSLQQARAYLVENTPDVIVLDSYLKDGFGIELMADFQLNNRNVPVMLVTSDNDQQTMARYFEAGVSDYLIKPANFDLMWLKLVRLIEMQRLQVKVAEQQKSLQQLLDAKNVEEELASHIFRHLSDSVFENNKDLNYLLLASTAFNGDFLISECAPNGKHYIMLFDATGHGLAAAISILPLTSIFSTMVKKGLPMASILFELNKKIDLDMPDDRFVAGILLEIDKQRNCLHIWNGGMPDVILFDKNREIVGKATSKHLPLGILDGHDFNTSTYVTVLDKLSDILFFSDGLMEQVNQNDEFFGMQRVLHSLQEAPDSDSLIETITKRFKEHSASSILSDDVSICHVNLAKLFAKQQKGNTADNQVSGSIDMNLAVRGNILGSFDVVGCIGHAMRESEMPIELRQKAFTVLTELYSNAFEHGVLGLESGLKSLEHGFHEYFEKKDSLVKLLSSEDEVVLGIHFDLQTKQIKIKVKDSGEGYDVCQAENTQNEFSGRGLTLVKKLTRQFEVLPPGNNASVVIK